MVVEYFTLTQPAKRAISVSFSTGLRISHEYSEGTSVNIPSRHEKLWNDIKDVCKDEDIKFVKRPNNEYTVIFLPMFIYWDIYKNQECGQDFLLYNVWRDSNNNMYEFARPEDYFSDLYDSINEKSGIYGIYGNNEDLKLLYLGYSKNLNSTFNKIRANWRVNEEDPCELFVDYDKSDVSFVEILTEDELLRIIHFDPEIKHIDLSQWQTTLYGLRKMMKPKYYTLKAMGHYIN